MIQDGLIPPLEQRPCETRQAVQDALAEANRLDDVLTDTIRAELPPSASITPAAPVPLAVLRWTTQRKSQHNP